jgi:uracil-DNA glycosylase family 4
MNREHYLTAMGITQWRLKSAVKMAESSSSTNDNNIQEDNWETLEATALQCTLCELCKTRTHVVFGVGNRQADLLIVGEAPGANEDKQGEPFVGQAGQLLNNMLKAINLTRQEVYIANVLKCRPPHNRDPKPEEVATCTPYLKRQIELINPKLIVALGRVAAHFLLGNTDSMANLRNKDFTYQNTPLLVTFHPAYLLRSPKEKVHAWKDLQRIQQLLASIPSNTHE